MSADAAVVYLMRDEVGEVIYVGLTGQPLKDRLRQHGYQSKWLSEVASIETSLVTSREDAHELEALVAAAFEPRHNGQLIPGRLAERKRAALAALIAEEGL